MSTQPEALKLALDALEESKTNNDTMEFHGRKNKAITAIKQALAAHVQEPLGFMNAGHVHEMQQGRLPYGYIYPKGSVGADVAIYTTPPAQPAVQEPIGHILIKESDQGSWFPFLCEFGWTGDLLSKVGIGRHAVYAAAQPAAWIGLTDYEIGLCSTEAAMNRSDMVGGAVTFARAIEAKLREKNGAEQQEEQVEQVEQVVEPTPQERRDAGQWHCPECYTFGHQHRRSCSLAKKGGAQ